MKTDIGISTNIYHLPDIFKMGQKFNIRWI